MTENQTSDSEHKAYSTDRLAETEALAWFTRLADESLSPHVRLEFLNWRAAKPENKQAYDRIAAFWGSSEFEQALCLDEKRINRRPKKRLIVPSLAIAASLLLTVWSVWQHGWLQRLRADDYTPVGLQLTLTLADGSSVLLDTDSAVNIAYHDRSRNITLLSGRAFFNVQPDPSRPFIVETGEERIRVVGTRFSVQRESDTPLAVRQGIVSYQADGTNTETLVRAGEQLQKSNSQVDVIKIDPQAPVFAWLEGRLKFNDRPLAEVIAEIDRYQPGVIVIGNPELATIHVSGNYKLHHPQSIIAALAQAAGAKVVHVTEYLTVLY